MKKRLRLTPILIAIMMVFTMMPVMGITAYAYDYPVQKSGEITLGGDVNDLQDQTITFKRLLNSDIDPSKILKTNFTSGDYTWAIRKAEPASQTVTLRMNGTEGSAFHGLTKNDAVKITCNYDNSETLLFSVMGNNFNRDIIIIVQGEIVAPSLGDDETITLKVGEKRTIADLAQILDDEGNSYILHEYNYQVGDCDRNIVSVENMAKDGNPAKDDDYITALNITGEKVGQTVVEVTLCNNDRVPIEVVDSLPPHITKKYTINVVANGEPDPTPTKISGTQTAKMVAKGKTGLTISWNRIQGADGYDIFFAPCNKNDKKNTCKNVKSISGNNTFKWTNSGLKKGTAYKSYVKAYVMRDGKKTYISTSPVMHAYTGGGNKKYTNAKSVTVKKKKVSLKKGKTYKIKAKVNKLKKGKRLMPKSHAPKLRYLTSDNSVATVNAKGKITAKGSGTCTITVFAHNGVSKNVKVTVK